MEITSAMNSSGHTQWAGNAQTADAIVKSAETTHSQTESLVSTGDQDRLTGFLLVQDKPVTLSPSTRLFGPSPAVFSNPVEEEVAAILDRLCGELQATDKQAFKTVLITLQSKTGCDCTTLQEYATVFLSLSPLWGGIGKGLPINNISYYPRMC